MKILRNIIRIFAAILLIANFILILSTRYEIFNVRTIKNTGDYMNPTIKDNDLVVSLKKSSYKKGEIILVKQTDEYYISRITNIDNYSVETKDDNRTTKNSLKNINDIEGKVVLVINKEVMMLYIITIALVCLLLVSDMFITLSTSTETNPLYKPELFRAFFLFLLLILSFIFNNYSINRTLRAFLIILRNLNFCNFCHTLTIKNITKYL